jgi:hypothetical protein
MDPDFDDFEQQLPRGTLDGAETGHSSYATPVYLGTGESIGGGDLLAVAFCISYDGRP